MEWKSTYHLSSEETIKKIGGDWGVEEGTESKTPSRKSDITKNTIAQCRPARKSRFWGVAPLRSVEQPLNTHKNAFSENKWEYSRTRTRTILCDCENIRFFFKNTNNKNHRAKKMKIDKLNSKSKIWFHRHPNILTQAGMPHKSINVIPPRTMCFTLDCNHSTFHEWLNGQWSHSIKIQKYKW